jgi:hypothetical protein
METRIIPRFNEFVELCEKNANTSRTLQSYLRFERPQKLITLAKRAYILEKYSLAKKVIQRAYNESKRILDYISSSPVADHYDKIYAKQNHREIVQKISLLEGELSEK